MKLFIIPSWYPSADYPSTGIFFKEQAQILARRRPEWKVGISLWGSHEPSLWIRVLRPLDAVIKLSSRFAIKSRENMLEANCIEFFTPAHTWTRRIKLGNIRRITKANEVNLSKFIAYYGKPDIILAEISYPAGWIAMELSKNHKIPYVIREQMSPFPLPAFRKVCSQLLIPSLMSAKKALAVGKNLQDELLEHKVSSIPAVNFIDTDFFHIEDSLDSPSVRILSIGRLVPQKGFDILVEALSKIKEKNWELTIGGSGPERGALERLAKQKGISNRIRFLGELDRIQVRTEIQSCNFFVLPSRHESFGIVLIEAMACGKPIVSTQCGGITDELPESVAITCKAEPADLTRAVEEMLKDFSKFDPKLIRNQVLSNYSVDQAAEIYEQILNKINQ